LGRVEDEISTWGWYAVFCTPGLIVSVFRSGQAGGGGFEAPFTTSLLQIRSNDGKTNREVMEAWMENNVIRKEKRSLPGMEVTFVKFGVPYRI
jgi:hypothetical protein